MTLENSIGIRSFLLCIYTNQQENKLLKVFNPCQFISDQTSTHFEIISSLTPSARKRSAISFFF